MSEALSPMREQLKVVRYTLTENPANLVAFALFGLLALAALFGPMLSPHDPMATNAHDALQSPSASYWFGTDQLGRDIFSRVLVATRLDLLIVLGAVLISCAVGTVIGAILGYFGALSTRRFSRVVDVLMAFPLFVLAMAMVAALGNTVTNVIVCDRRHQPFLLYPPCPGQVMVRRTLGYVEAARAEASDMRASSRTSCCPVSCPGWSFRPPSILDGRC